MVQRKAYLSGGKKVSIPWEPDEMLRHTKYYAYEMHPEAPEHVYDTQVEVWKMDCLDAAQKVQKEDAESGRTTEEDRTAVLNMANRQNPGGGVYTGSGAQEESIFLRTNIYTALYPYSAYSGEYGLPEATEHYPLDRNYGGIWSGNVTVFRDKECSGYKLLSNPWKTNFITVAALNSPATVTGEGGELRLRDDLILPALHKIRTIMNIAADQKVSNLILGAMGCGAFHNPPEHIAELFRQVLNEPEYKGRFRRVAFAILGDQLYKTFSKVFSEI